jgi:hypothetical protein
LLNTDGVYQKQWFMTDRIRPKAAYGLDCTEVLSEIICMLIKCQRCSQGYVRAMRVRSTNISLWVCEECEATWPSQDEVNTSIFEDYGTLMVGIGRSCLWSELEPQ